MVHLRRFLLLLLALATLTHPRAHAADLPTLSAEERAFLERLYTDCGLVDPRGAVRLRFAPAGWSPDAQDSYLAYGAWLLPGRDGQPGVAVFANGLPMPLPYPADMVVSPTDFIGTCQALYGDAEVVEPGLEAKEARTRWYANKPTREAAQRLRMPPDGAIAVLDDPTTGSFETLLAAAWLMRLGRQDLAATALRLHRRTAREEESRLSENLRGGMEGGCRSLAEREFLAGRDSQAYAVGIWADQRYGTQEQTWNGNPTVRADLQRRRALGRFGVVRDATLPEGFDGWPLAQRLDWLIDSLDDVTEFGMVSSSGDLIIEDPRALAIVELGDAAVPTLLQAMATDGRLSRTILSNYKWWYSSTSTVPELIGAVLQEIFRIRDLAQYLVPEPDRERERTPWRPPYFAPEAYTLYWQRYGHLPLDQRLMAMLTDPKADLAARRECALALSMIDVPFQWDAQRQFANTVQQPPAGAPNPLVARYQDPTVAEAILAAMADDLRALTATLDAEHVTLATRESWREPTTTSDSSSWPCSRLRDYLTALACMRDGRIAPAVAARAATMPTYDLRFTCAKTAAALGDFSAITAMGDAWVRGELVLRSADGDTQRRLYLEPLLEQLVLSGEPRFAPAIAALAMERPATEDLYTRGKWIRQAMALGDSSAMLQLAAEVEAGRLLPSDASDTRLLAGLLLEAHLPAADRAYLALMSPDGPAYATVYSMATHLIRYDGPWLQTPEGLALLDRWLADTTPTGAVFVRTERTVVRTRESEGSSWYEYEAIPEGADLANYDTRVELRACDDVAKVLSVRIIGLPDFHVLRQDRDARIAEMRATLSRYGARLQSADSEIEHLPFSLPWPPPVAGAESTDIYQMHLRSMRADRWRFALAPLDHPATPADVAQGRALFHLDGHGTRLELALPAWAEVLPESRGGPSVPGQVLQAERDADGQVYYGVLTTNRFSQLPADRVRLLSSDEAATLVASVRRQQEVYSELRRRRWRFLVMAM